MGLTEWLKAWAAPQAYRYDTTEMGLPALSDEQLSAISESPELYDAQSRRAVWSEMKRRIDAREREEAEARDLQRKKEVEEREKWKAFGATPLGMVRYSDPSAVWGFLRESARPVTHRNVLLQELKPRRECRDDSLKRRITIPAGLAAAFESRLREGLHEGKAFEEVKSTDVGTLEGLPASRRQCRKCGNTGVSPTRECTRCRVCEFYPVDTLPESCLPAITVRYQVVNWQEPSAGEMAGLGERLVELDFTVSEGEGGGALVLGEGSVRKTATASLLSFVTAFAGQMGTLLKEAGDDVAVLVTKTERAHWYGKKKAGLLGLGKTTFEPQ